MGILLSAKVKELLISRISYTIPKNVYGILNNVYQLYENPCIFMEVKTWTDEQTDRIYECIKTFKYCRKVLKIPSNDQSVSIFNKSDTNKF